MNIEIAKLLVDSLTPISVVIIGYFINKIIALQSQRWKENDKLISKRVEIYSEMAEPLNQIYCYVQDVGDYKKLDPKVILMNKRVVDRLFHTYRPIWSRATILAYKSFINSAFVVFTGSGDDAKIKTISKNKVAASDLGKGKWLSDWAGLITEERDPKHHEKYVALMNSFSNDLGFKAS